MIIRYQDISIVYGGKGRKYAEELDKKIKERANKDRFPVKSSIVMEEILTGNLMSKLIELFRSSEFCVTFLTSEDLSVVGDTNKGRMRQNVVFELGMALIQLGQERCIILSDFDCHASDFDLPSDMASLAIYQIDPDNLAVEMDRVIDKILALSKTSFLTGEKSGTPPQYDYLLTRKTFYVDYENLFAEQLTRKHLEGKRFFVQTLADWYDECRSLPYFDERCMYLFERLGFLPVFGPLPEVNDFLYKIAPLVESYKEADKQYYQNDELLEFVQNLVANIIEYTQIKSGPDVNNRRKYSDLLEAFMSEDIPQGVDINPLIKVVYYDYLGLVWLRLYRCKGSSEELDKAKEAFLNALDWVGEVDLSLHIWKGFITYNLARTYSWLGEYEYAKIYFRKAIDIRTKWSKNTNYNITVHNALSSEYFLAKMDFYDMGERSGSMTKIDLAQNYATLETELNAYSDFEDKPDPLQKIRKRLAIQRSKYPVTVSTEN